MYYVGAKCIFGGQKTVYCRMKFVVYGDLKLHNIAHLVTLFPAHAVTVALCSWDGCSSPLSS